MIARTVLVYLFLTVSVFCLAQKGPINRDDFYRAMASDKLELISSQQEIAKSAGDSGFEGALLMKKAGLMKKTGDKLSLFKSGHKLLDNAIKKDESNAELRFLRLMIQEHAPGILHYKNDIEKDSVIIREGFSQLHPEAKKAILQYSKTSKVLKPSDFNGS
jgi:hypothetical protein